MLLEWVCEQSASQERNRGSSVVIASDRAQSLFVIAQGSQLVY